MQDRRFFGSPTRSSSTWRPAARSSPVTSNRSAPCCVRRCSRRASRSRPNSPASTRSPRRGGRGRRQRLPLPCASLRHEGLGENARRAVEDLLVGPPRRPGPARRAANGSRRSAARASRRPSVVEGAAVLDTGDSFKDQSSGTPTRAARTTRPTPRASPSTGTRSSTATAPTRRGCRK